MKGAAGREIRKLFTRNPSAIRASYVCRSCTVPRHQPRRQFHGSRGWQVVKPYLLADIGEGITECQVIQWFVKPGARVEQFDPICEVQSDKASVEITSRFDGVIKKLYYDPDDMAKVGKPLVDIDIQSEISEADEALLVGGSGKESEKEAPKERKTSEPQEQGLELGRNDTKAVLGDTPEQSPPPTLPTDNLKDKKQPQRQPGKHSTLAIPAVRHLIKELNFNIEDILGTGKDGRVTKEDVQNHAETLKEPPATSTGQPLPPSPPAPATQIEDHVRQLTPIQRGMFKEMTRSLSIPHLLYTDAIDFTSLTSLRKTLNSHAKEKSDRVSALPFIIKAVSLALQDHPILNAHLDTSNPEKPQILVKGRHNIGVAIDSPAGLLVPVIKDVQSHTILSLSTEITRLSGLARSGKLSSADLSGATFTVSNIGSIGGTVVSPVIVSPQVGILGIGKSRAVPGFGKEGEVVRREECVFSWSADHRVVDGAVAARCAERVRGLLEDVGAMLVRLR